MPTASPKMSGLSALPNCPYDQGNASVYTVPQPGVHRVPLEQEVHLANPQTVKLSRGNTFCVPYCTEGHRKWGSWNDYNWWQTPLTSQTQQENAGPNPLSPQKTMSMETE